MKTCTRCQTPKALTEYHRNKSTKDGLNYWCKECMKDYHLGKGSSCTICSTVCDRRATLCNNCSPRKGKDHPSWKGGRFSERGYIKVWTEDGYVLEHRKVYMDHHDIQLEPWETIHHKNGVKDDNRIENLELWVMKQPRGQRPEDLIRYAKEILERYDK